MAPKHEEVLAFMRKFQRENEGIPASLRDIMEGCGISSTSVAAYAVHRLEDAGVVIQRGATPYRQRYVALDPLSPRRVVEPCPLCGCPGGHL